MQNMMENRIIIHCDGACIPNPGKGSWGALVRYPDGTRKELKGASDEEETTNQRMEILAAIMALESLRDPSTIQVFSDSQYLIKSMNGKWRRKANLDLWGKLKCAAKGHEVSWQWVKGHDGNEDNERAHELATLASPASVEEREAFAHKCQTRKTGDRSSAAGRTFQRRNARKQARRARRKDQRSLSRYPAELRELPNNRYGGDQTIRMRTYNAQLAMGFGGGVSRLYRGGKAGIGEKDAG